MKKVCKDCKWYKTKDCKKYKLLDSLPTHLKKNVYCDEFIKRRSNEK